MLRKNNDARPWSQISWWVVVAAGAITVFFMVAIIREVVRTATVRRQVDRLQQELAQETKRQSELQDLIGYLGSPTFQEREARLKLGLKKSGERVIVIPDNSNTNQSVQSGGQLGQSPRTTTIPNRWWQYFFGVQPSSLST